MRGISGSGKSTRAAEIAKDTGAVIVNRDQIRKMMLNSWWTGDKDDEDRVTVAETALVRAQLDNGVSVIVDATHIHPPFLRKWARLATRLGAEFNVVDVHADLDECKRRVYDRWQREMGTDSARYLAPEIIDRQARRLPVGQWPTIVADPPFIVEPVAFIDGLPEAIIVDIDGTAAHNLGGRSPYDYSRVSEDTPDLVIRGLIDAWVDDPNYNERSREQRYVLFVSGRDSVCERATRNWLHTHGFLYDHLWMRPTNALDVHGGKKPDFMVKYDLFNEHIRGGYNVQFVLDDRDQVVRVWRQLGLKCLQVAEGDF